MATGRIPTTANSPLTAKGDLFTFSTGSAKLAVGSNGDTLVADSAATTGLRWQGNYAAGKNKIINGDFNINQRAFSSVTANGTYTFDRFVTNFSGGTVTFTPQTFTPGAAPVSGYEATNFLQIVTSGQSASNYASIGQKIENVRTFAGQTVTLSFWAKATSGTPKIGWYALQNFGSGGSSAAAAYAGYTENLSSSWARYSITYAVPSISGKTIGTSSSFDNYLMVSDGAGTQGIQNNTFQIWGVQIENGSTATAFQTATGTLQGELAACQRYYWNLAGDNQYVGIGYNQSATEMNVGIVNPVAMRTVPTLTVATGTNYYGFKRNGADDNFNSLSSTASFASVTGQMLFNSTEISGTAGQAGTVRTNNASAKIEFSSEL
jgi:hypothetical protein